MKKINIESLKTANSLAFFNILGPLILNGLNFFTIPIFTRMLGTANYGEVSLYVTWVQILTILVGLQTSGTIATAKVHLSAEENNKYSSSSLFLSFCFFILFVVFTIIFINPIADLIGMSKFIIIVALFNSFGAYVISFATLRFTFNKQAYKTFFMSIIVSISVIVLSLIFISSITQYENKELGRILGAAIPNIIIGFIIFIFILMNGKVLYSKKYWMFCLPICLPLIFHGLSHIILGQSDRIMLQYFTNESMVGVYSLIYSIAQILNIIWSALNNTWVPLYYDDIKENNIINLKNKTKNYMILFTILTVGFIYISPEVVRVFASAEFWLGIDIIPIIALSSFFIFLYSFPVNFQFYHKKTVTIAIGTTSAAILNILLNSILIPKYNIFGAAIATLISYFALFIFHEVVAIYIIKKNYIKNNSVIYIIYVLIAVAIFYFIKDMWILRWLIGGVLGLYLLLRTIKNKTIF